MSILEKYACVDSRIVIINQSNKGVAAARNAALDKATGEYISFVDSDDELIPEAYERLICVEQNDVDVIMFGANLLCEDGSSPSSEDIKYLEIPKEGYCLIDDDLLARLSVYPWNKLYRRESIERFNLRFPVHCLFEDACFFYCFFSVCRRVYFIQDKLYIYFRRNNSIMAQTYQKKENHGVFHILIFDQIYEFWNKNNVFKGREDIFCERFSTYVNLAFNSSPDFEYSRCAWEATRRLREWNIDTMKFPLLHTLKNGSYLMNAMSDSLFLNNDETDKKVSIILFVMIKIIIKLLCVITTLISKITNGNIRKTMINVRDRLKYRLKIVKTMYKHGARW